MDTFRMGGREIDAATEAGVTPGRIREMIEDCTAEEFLAEVTAARAASAPENAHLARQARIARYRVALNVLPAADVLTLAGAPTTDDDTRWAAILVASARRVGTVWITYPDQGDDFGAIETVLAWGTCEVCGVAAHGMTSTDAGIHVCHPCQYAAAARGVVRFVTGE